MMAKSPTLLQADTRGGIAEQRALLTTAEEMPQRPCVPKLFEAVLAVLALLFV